MCRTASAPCTGLNRIETQGNPVRTAKRTGLWLSLGAWRRNAVFAQFHLSFSTSNPSSRGRNLLIDNKLVDTMCAQRVAHILLDDPCRRAARIGGAQRDIEHISGISHIANNPQIDE